MRTDYRLQTIDQRLCHCFVALLLAMTLGAATIAHADINDGLIGHWSFDDNGGEISSDSCQQSNSSCTPHPGVLSNNPEWVTGQIKGAINFPNTSSRVVTGSDFIGTGEVSVCGWFYARSSKPGTFLLSNGKFSISTANYNRLGLSSNGANSLLSNVDAVTLNTWNHFCVTRDAAGLGEIYINTAPSDSINKNSGTPMEGIRPVTIGNHPFAPYAFDGYLDDVRLYRRVVSMVDIINLYNLGNKLDTTKEIPGVPVVNGQEITAASCKQIDVQVAIYQAKDGQTVIVPAGSCTWNKTLNITKKLILKGMGIDKTIIDCTNLNPCFSMNVATNTWRLTGFTINNGARPIKIDGLGNSWRVDHNKISNSTIRSIWVTNASSGVIDHNHFYNDLPDTPTIIQVNGAVDGDMGFSQWEKPYVWGTSEAVFMEDNQVTINVPSDSIDYAAMTDGGSAGKMVVRYNHLLNSHIVWHGFDSGSYAGTIGGEVYNNTIVADKQSSKFFISRAVHTRSGVLAFHNNVIKGGYQKAVVSYPYRMSPGWYEINNKSWPITDGTQWKMCSNSRNFACNDTAPAHLNETLVGDAYCAAMVGGESTCSVMFCSNNKDKLCSNDSQCPLGGKCNAYFDGDGNDPAGYPSRGQPGIGPGGQVSQPMMSWGNKFCNTSIDCIAQPKVDIISGGLWSIHPGVRENRDYFNCTSQADCEAKTGKSYQTYTYPHPLITSGFTADAPDVKDILGDVSGDGKISMYDAAMVLRYTLGTPLSDAQKKEADINTDGKIDGADVVAIARKALGL